MTPHEIEALLEGASESPALDFKHPMRWDSNSFVKDFLAMANLPAGGRIIVGVEEDKSASGTSRYVRRGVDAVTAATFDPDIMKDQIDQYADPQVEFSVTVAKDGAGLTYVIIKVHTFTEQIVICKRDGKEVKAGDIYYRRTRGRAQSGRVDSAHDMRSILLLAQARTNLALRSIGLDVTKSAATADFYNQELEGL